MRYTKWHVMWPFHFSCDLTNVYLHHTGQWWLTKDIFSPRCNLVNQWFYLCYYQDYMWLKGRWSLEKLILVWGMTLRPHFWSSVYKLKTPGSVGGQSFPSYSLHKLREILVNLFLYFQSPVNSPSSSEVRNISARGNSYTRKRK